MAWKKVKLRDVLIKKNLRLKDEPNLRNPVVLGVTNNEGIVKSKVEAGQKVGDYFVVEKGDFVYNPYRINVGSIGISKLGGITSLAYVVFNVDERKLNKYLLFKLLKSEFGVNQIVKNGRGSVRNALRYDDLAKIELNLPSIEEQNKFAGIFKIEEEKINRLKLLYFFQLIQIENLNQAILQEAVQGKLVVQNKNDDPAGELLKRIKEEKAKFGKKGKLLPPIKPEEIPFEIPESWVWCKIDELVSDYKNDIRTGPFGTSLNKSEHKLYGIPVWGIESISKDGRFTNRNKIFVTKEKANDLKSFGVKGGDLIISRSGTIGELCMLPYGINYGLLSTNLMKISVNPSVIMPEFFCHIIKGGIYIRETLTELCSGSTRLFITQAILSKLVFPLPPLSEQKRIVVVIEKQLAKTKQLKEHIIANQQATEQLLKALLHEAFEM